jgi:hypothetical protein
VGKFRARSRLGGGGFELLEYWHTRKPALRAEMLDDAEVV